MNVTEYLKSYLTKEIPATIDTLSSLRNEVEENGENYNEYRDMIQFSDGMLFAYRDIANRLYGFPKYLDNDESRKK